MITQGIQSQLTLTSEYLKNKKYLLYSQLLTVIVFLEQKIM